MNSIEKSRKEEQSGKQKTLKNSKVVPLVSNTASTGATTLPGRHTLFTVQDATETNSQAMEWLIKMQEKITGDLPTKNQLEQSQGHKVTTSNVSLHKVPLKTVQRLDQQ